MQGIRVACIPRGNTGQRRIDPMSFLHYKASNVSQAGIVADVSPHGQGHAHVEVSVRTPVNPLKHVGIVYRWYTRWKKVLNHVIQVIADLTKALFGKTLHSA